jgi:PhzF family phenazine biosynthesis protein
MYQVDAFTDQVFKGNPAGVCILSPGEMDNNSLLQNIAMEMNLSETAFIAKKGDGYRLRWFTPETEVSLCGHATITAAHILWENGSENKNDVIKFDTLSGELSARYLDGKVELDFPVFQVKETPAEVNISNALGVEPVFMGLAGNGYHLTEVSDYAILQGIHPDFEKLREIGRTGYIVTCKSDNPDYDFYSRFFAPALGINEDPVTGSAYSSLAPYWSKKLGKNLLRAYQASKRGGIVECVLTPNSRVLIRGNAITVFEINMITSQ